MTKRTFYKRTVTLEVLSEEPIPSGMTLASILWEAEHGDYSMREFNEKEAVLNAKQAAKALRRQGSDPVFFQLDNDGNDSN